MRMDSATLIGLANETYEILEKLGEGGFGEVYLARKQPLGKLVALKLLRSRVSEDAERRLWAEARLLASLHHPGIVVADDLVRLDGRRGLVSESIEGEDLSSCFKGGMPASAVVEVVGQVAWALHAAAQKGVVHRDVKPQNVRLGRYGNAKLLDFGSAREQALDQEVEPTREMSGTPRYMAPERFRFEFVPASDVFSLGCILWLGLKGRHFYGESRTFEAIFPLTRSDTSWSSLLEAPAPEPMPRGVQELLRDMLARGSETRPSAMEVGRRCEAILEDWPGRVRLREWCRERWDGPLVRQDSQRGDHSYSSLSRGPAASEPVIEDEDTTERTAETDHQAVALPPPRKATPVPAPPTPPADLTSILPREPTLVPDEDRSPAVLLGLVALGLLLGCVLLGGSLVTLLMYSGEGTAARPSLELAAPAGTDATDPSGTTGAPGATDADGAQPPEATPAKPAPARPEPEATTPKPAPARPAPAKPVPAKTGPAKAAPKTGGLSDPVAVRDMISQRLGALTPGLSSCYQQRLAVSPSLQGRWRLAFSVLPSGEVAEISVSALERADGELEQCLTERVRSWRFEAIEQVQPVSRTLRFPD
jgi:serine/threonine protein kinase